MFDDYLGECTGSKLISRPPQTCLDTYVQLQVVANPVAEAVLLVILTAVISDITSIRKALAPGALDVCPYCGVSAQVPCGLRWDKLVLQELTSSTAYHHLFPALPGIKCPSLRIITGSGEHGFQCFIAGCSA